MKAGQLDRQVTLQRAQTVKDAFGNPVETWTDMVRDLAASATPVSDAERVRGAEVAAVITHRFQVRWGPAWSDLDPADRLLFEGQIYNIGAVKELGRRVGLEISASARADGA